MPVWNTWHGCHKHSAGCENCYVYRTDAKYGRDASIVKKTGDFFLPLKRDKSGEYKLQPPEIVYTCFTSDFFIEEADNWRLDCWHMMAERSDLDFLIITKRPERFEAVLPWDWGDGYENVTVCVTCENQDRADFRLPIFKGLPIKHKMIICEPLLEGIDLSPYLDESIEGVVVGGESGQNARECNFDWVLDIRRQCIEARVDFSFKQTGANFVKNGRRYFVERKYQHSQAKRAGIDVKFKERD